MYDIVLVLNSVNKNPRVFISTIDLLIIVFKGQEVSQQVGEVNVVKGKGVDYQSGLLVRWRRQGSNAIARSAALAIEEFP